MYRCKFCGKEFETKQKLGGHSVFCDGNPNKYDNLKKLENNRKKHTGGRQKINEESCNCRFCGRICKNNNSLRNHERLCSCNPNKQVIKSNFIKYNEWRRENGIKGCNHYTKAEINGLPKPEMSEQTRQKLREKSLGRKHSEDTKQKISEKQKQNYKGKSRWKTAVEHRLSYAEQYFLQIFTNAEFQYHVDRFFLDFAWPDNKIYIEIDGSQHKNDPKVIKHDIERTEILSNLGWKLIDRVYWPDFVKLDEEQKKEYIKKLFNEINIG